MIDHAIVTRDEWLDARKALLAEEKAFTRTRDALSARRRALPWVKIDKPYRFETPDGVTTLHDAPDRPILRAGRFRSRRSTEPRDEPHHSAHER